jgi:hypothetical protein
MALRPLIAAVALADDALPAADAVLGYLQQHWPQIPVVAAPSQRPGVLLFNLEEDAAGAALLPKPLPWEDLAGPCAAAWYWPDAAQAFREHQTRLIATLMTRSHDRIGSALRLTALVAAAASCSSAVGIYWNPGRLVHAPADFLQESLTMSRENLPLNLWIDFRIQEEPDGGHALFTTGLAAFGHRELEIWQSQQSPQFLRACAYNVAHYVLQRGAALKANETIGLSDEERIPITIEPSRWDASMTVVRLEV